MRLRISSRLAAAFRTVRAPSMIDVAGIVAL
jgi:hypothetical protein